MLKVVALSGDPKTWLKVINRRIKCLHWIFQWRGVVWIGSMSECGGPIRLEGVAG